MKIDTGDALPLGLKFTWICTRCNTDEFDQMDDVIVRCRECGALYDFELLKQANKARHVQFYEELAEKLPDAISRAFERSEAKRRAKLDARKNGEKTLKKTPE